MKLGWVWLCGLLWAACAAGAPATNLDGLGLDGSLPKPPTNGTGGSQGTGGSGTGGMMATGGMGGTGGRMVPVRPPPMPRDAGMSDSGSSEDASNAERCGDTKKNGLETGTDCGGPDCMACEDDKGCIVDTDCVSGNCGSGFLCSTPGCDDGEQNVAETDVDCGGGTCPGCVNAKKCMADGDCTSGFCNPNMRCACKPKTPDMVCGAMECGMKQDGCTGMVTCPFMCPSGEVCVRNACAPMCVASSCPRCFGFLAGCCRSDNACGCPVLTNCN